MSKLYIYLKVEITLIFHVNILKKKTTKNFVKNTGSVLFRTSLYLSSP